MAEETRGCKGRKRATAGLGGILGFGLCSLHSATNDFVTCFIGLPTSFKFSESAPVLRFTKRNQVFTCLTATQRPEISFKDLRTQRREHLPIKHVPLFCHSPAGQDRVGQPCVGATVCFDLVGGGVTDNSGSFFKI